MNDLPIFVFPILFGFVAVWLRFRRKIQQTKITINVEDDPDWTIYRKIQNALEQCPRILHLEIVGYGRIHPTVVLSIHDLLLNRNASTKLHIAVKTNLVDGSLIFLIHAQRVEIREHAWFQCSSVKEIETQFRQYNESWDCQSQDNTVDESPIVTDHRIVAEILNAYLPLKEFGKQRLPLEITMEEFGLIKNHRQEEDLLRLLGR
jgi:hypothetical protein